MNDSKRIRNSTAEFLIFVAQNEADSVEVRFEDENICLTQQLMADLFEATRANITQHISNILSEQELTDSVCKEFLRTTADGKNYRTKHYNLDAIIAVGYRVNSCL